MDILDIAHRNQQKAWKIVEATRIIPMQHIRLVSYQWFMV